jgi:hypothetical protein
VAEGDVVSRKHSYIGLDRGIYETCGKLRSHAVKQCSCSRSTPAQAVAEGDVVSRKQWHRGDSAAIAVDKSDCRRHIGGAHNIDIHIYIYTTINNIYIYTYIYI